MIVTPLPRMYARASEAAASDRGHRVSVSGSSGGQAGRPTGDIVLLLQINAERFFYLELSYSLNFDFLI